MTPQLIDLTRLDDQQDPVGLAVQALSQGQLVAFPTETVYGIAAGAWHEKAVSRLLQIKGRRPGNALTLAIRNSEAAEEYCPTLSAVGRRLARRCWPGPLTLVHDGQAPAGPFQSLPAVVRQAVAPHGTIGLRVPDHPLLLATLRHLPGPLVLTSANRSGQADALSGEEVLQALGDDIDVVFSDGRSKYAQPSTVIQVTENRVRILRQGVLSESALRRNASVIVLLVCTGNTCRSPMAQVILQQSLAARLGCSIDRLEEGGVMILSAGVAAYPGGQASEEAVQAMRLRGLDLSHHESRPLSDVLVRFADLILTMTRGHREAILGQWPEADSRTALVCQDGSDVADPIGGSVAVYERSANQMTPHLDQWASRIADESRAVWELATA